MLLQRKPRTLPEHCQNIAPPSNVLETLDRMPTARTAEKNNPPSQSEDSPEWQPLTSFPQFIRLSPEIRLMIWKLHMPGPRIITITEGCRGFDQEDMSKDIDLSLWNGSTRQSSTRYHNPHNDRAVLYFEIPLVIQTIPTLFHICHETRAEAKKIWSFHYHRHSQRPQVIINPSRDTLYFTSVRAWELFTRTSTGSVGVFVARRLLSSEDGHKEPTVVARAYNAALTTKLVRQHGEMYPDRELLTEMEDTLKYLAIGGSKDIATPRHLSSQLWRFWKLKMLVIEKTVGWQYRDQFRRFILSDANEVFLKRHWRVESTQCKDHDEWLERKEEFEHIALPRIEYVGEGTMNRRLRADEGFDENFRAGSRPPNPFDRLLLI
jgi:hypothetical protein